MTGSVFSAGLAVVGILNLLGVQIGIQVSLWAAGMAFAVTVAAAVYLAGREEHQERLSLAGRLRPKLEICGIGPASHDHRRIMVRNLTGSAIRFKARLVETKPSLRNYALSVDLQPTHCQSPDNVGEIGPNADQAIDVFVDSGMANNDLGLKLAGNPLCLHPIPRNQRTELLISVYPISEEGRADSRWFYIVPQPDGSVIFTSS